MFPSQTNTQKGGTRSYNSGIALAGLEGRLVKIVDSGSIAELLLPELLSDICLFVVVDGGAIDTESQVQPLVPGEEIRIRNNGVAAAGAIAVLEVIAGANIGKIRTLPATPGVYFSPGSYAEDAVDEQLAKINPLPRIIVVADSVAAPAAIAPVDGIFAALNSTAVNPTKADFDALLVQLEIMNDSRIANAASLADLRTKLITAGVIVAP